jgi:Xaa-Pro dipeptidase
MQPEAGTISYPIEEECKRRVRTVRKQMMQTGVDALLLFTGPNLFYFTGMPCGRSGSRPFVFLLPRKGEPVLIVHNGRQFEARQFAQVNDIRTYESLSHLPLATVLEALKDHNLLQGRIGVELGGEMVLDLPFADFQALIDAAPQIEFVDASDLLWKLRMVKSQAEIAQVARACQITSQAYQLTFASVHAGMTEIEVQALMVRQWLLV